MENFERDIVNRHQQAAPVDITALAVDLGLSVYNDDALARGVSGMVARDHTGASPSGYFIAVNSCEPFRRRRFTIAHECGHYLLHREKIGDGILDDAMYRSEKMNTKEEFEANNMAADLLMPQKLIREYVRSGEVGLHALAERFLVSEAAMQVRLRYLFR